MIYVESITSKEKLERIMEALLDNHQLPSFLFEDGRYAGVVVALKSNDGYVGVAYGVTEHGKESFFIHFIYIAREYRRTQTVIHLLSALLEAAMNIKKIREAMWKYVINKDKKDARPSLLSAIPFCHVEDVKEVRIFRLRTKDFEYLKRFKWYKPMQWEEMGYAVSKWSECREDMKDKIREREKGLRGEADYLSPFLENEDDSWVPDERTTFVLMNNATQQPVGWMLSQQLSETEVKIRRFYTYAEERRTLVSPYFAVYVLEAIAPIYEYLYFDVVKGNRQMEKFAYYWCKPILDLDCVQCNLKIKIQEAQT